MAFNDVTTAMTAETWIINRINDAWLHDDDDDDDDDDDEDDDDDYDDDDDDDDDYVEEHEEEVEEAELWRNIRKRKQITSAATEAPYGPETFLQVAAASMMLLCFWSLALSLDMVGMWENYTCKSRSAV